MKSNNTIEINGKLYDAKTGKPIDSPHKASATPTAKPRPQLVDGFRSVQPQKRSITVQHATPKQPNEGKVAKTPQPTKRTHSAAPKAASKPKQSATLHRKAVRRPVIQPEATSSASKKVASTAKKHADSARTERAMLVHKSNVISHFGQSAAVTPIAHSAKSTPLTKHIVSTHHTEPMPVTPTGTQTKERLIQQAVEKAVSGTPAKKPKVKAKRSTASKITRYASTFAVVVLLGGYVAYLNVPSISMKVAASRAGFAASLPSYTPGGYSLNGPIAYTPGQVTVDFHANTDDRSFSIKQQPTTWDSVALLENFVTKQGKSYLTYQDRGLTIYIYNGSSAAWVNGGKMYSLEGKNSQLDTDQLLKLATSM